MLKITKSKYLIIVFFGYLIEESKIVLLYPLLQSVYDLA